MVFRAILVSILICLTILSPFALILEVSRFVASDIDGRVYILVSRDLMDKFKGYTLGALIVSMDAPGSSQSFSFRLSDVAGGRLFLDLRGAARAWLEFYSSDVGRKLLEASPPLPTLSVTFTLYNGDIECVAHYTYSTVDYFVERGYNIITAIEMAGKDPLAHLRKPLAVVLRPKMAKSEVRVECVDISPTIDKLRELLGGEPSPHTLPSMVSAAAQKSCPPSFESVWWADLYNSRDNPPEGWYRNIFHPSRDIPDDKKLEVWRFYAERYSKAYYWLASRYSLEEAIRNTDSMLGLPGSEGIYSMDSWVNEVSSRVLGIRGAQWRDYHENYNDNRTIISGNMPYLGVYMVNPSNKRVFVGAAFAIAGLNKKGVSIVGLRLIGDELLFLASDVVTLLASSHNGRMYAAMWTAYYYSSDAILVKYDVRTVEVEDCRYWVVIPVSAFLPRYATIINLGSLNSTLNPDYLTSVVYSAKLNTVYAGVVSGSSSHWFLYEDSNTLAEKLVKNHTSFLLTFNIVADMVELTFTNLQCGEHPVCKHSGIVVAYLLNHVLGDLDFAPIAFHVSLHADLVDHAVVRVAKATPWAAEAYPSLGWQPILVEYRVYVDVEGDEAICTRLCSTG